MKFIKKLIVYGIGNIMTRAISFLLIPLYTRYILPDDYGKLDIIYYTASVLVSLIFMEVWTAFLKFGLENKDIGNVNKVFTNVMILSLFSLIPYILVQAIVTYIIGVDYIVLSVIYGISLLLMNIYQIYTRITGNSKLFVLSGILNSTVQIVVAVLMILLFRINALTMLIAPTIGALTATLFLEFKSRLSIRFSKNLIDRSFMKVLLKFSIPLAFNSVAYWAITNLNRYYAAYYFGYEEASYLSVVNKVTLVLTLAGSIYSLAWQESAFEQIHNKERSKYYTNMFSIYLAIFTAATVVFITLFNLLFPILIGQNYINAQILLVPTFLITFFSGIAGFFGQIFNAEKMTKKLMTSTLIGFIINISALLYLTRFFGLIAVPIVTAISFAFVSFIRIALLKKKKLFQFQGYEILVSLLFIFLISTLNYFINDIENLIIILFASVVILIIVYNKNIKNLVVLLKRRY